MFPAYKVTRLPQRHREHRGALYCRSLDGAMRNPGCACDELYLPRLQNTSLYSAVTSPIHGLRPTGHPSAVH